jgi:hypothetical protein
LARTIIFSVVIVIVLVAVVSLYSYGLQKGHNSSSISTGQNSSIQSSSTGTPNLSPSVVKALVVVKTAYSGSDISLAVNASLSPNGPQSLLETLTAQNGTLPDGAQGYLGYYSGDFVIGSGAPQGTEVNLTVSYHGFSSSGSTLAPPAGGTDTIPLVVSTLLEATPPVALSVSNGASTCPSLGGSWNSSNVCTISGVVNELFELQAGVKVVLTSSATLYVPGDLYIEYPSTLTSYGTIINDGGSIYNSGGTFNNYGGLFIHGTNSTMEIGGGERITNYGTLNDDGSITNYGALDNRGTILIGPSGSLDGLSGSISNEGNITNSGTIVPTEGSSTFSSSGSISNLGTIDDSYGPVTNDGSINNFGTIVDDDGSITNNGIFNNYSGATLTNTPGAEFTNGSNDTLNNYGVFNNEAGSGFHGYIINHGTINNGGFSGETYDAGIINNEGYFENYGATKNSVNGVIDNGGTFTNCGTFSGLKPFGNSIASCG